MTRQAVLTQPDAPGPPREQGPGDRAWRRDDGSATILTVAGVGVLTTLLLSGLLLASVVAASHRARSAADLGALAGAASVQEGHSPATACARASLMVVRNGARLVSCEFDGQGAVLLAVAAAVAGPKGISLSLGVPGGGPLMAKARARAGPSP